MRAFLGHESPHGGSGHDACPREGVTRDLRVPSSTPEPETLMSRVETRFVGSLLTPPSQRATP